MAFRREDQTSNPIPGAGYVIATLLGLLGRLVAATPEPVLRAASVLGGEAILWLAPRRRRLLRSNLHHAFPDRPRAWRRRVARVSSQRLVETGLLSLAVPYLSDDRILAMAVVGDSVNQWASRRQAEARPTFFGTLHLALWESQTWYTRVSAIPLPPFGIIFRPLDHPALDAFVKQSRERHGMLLLSRREGFAAAMKLLRANGCIGALFDQNAGMQGALTLLFGRVCSSSELPGLLASKFDAEVRTYYPVRTGFWRVRFESDPIASDGSAAGVTLALNRWLEQRLGADEDLCASWLWAHDRWRNQDVPARRLRLEMKRNLLARDVAERGLPALPRRTRVWVRMPNWLGDVVMALPLLRALRASRPDAEVTLLARAAFVPLLESWPVADRVRPLPERGGGYFPHFIGLRAQYVDVWILLTHSLRGDLEARLAGCRQRFGISRPGRTRPLLSHTYARPEGYDEAAHHQLDLWEDFLRHFGLEGPLDRTPLGWTPAAAAAGPGPIALIPGSENLPAKRWPVSHWRSLIASLPGERFVLFGTGGDAPITAAVAAGFGDRVEDRAGRTTLPQFAAGLAACRLLVANDTGGLHLANALGVPVIGLFGPTNPVRTGPVFAAFHRVLQPPGCPPQGGADLAALDPAAVRAAVLDLPTPAAGPTL